MEMIRFPALVFGVAAVLTRLVPAADEWPQFRGPHSDNRPAAAEFPTAWSADKNIAWKTPIPGHGWSSPILWGDKVFVTTAVEEQASTVSGRRRRGGVYRWELRCLNLNSGKSLWTRVATRGEPRLVTHKSNGYASETPVTDGERVYAYFGMTGLFAYDFNGELVWKKDLGAYPMQREWGTSSSPLLHANKLYLQIDSEEDSFLVALNPKTGEEIWRVMRDEGSNWSTPMIWRNKKRIELVTVGCTTRSYDPENGELLWKLHIGGRSSSSSTGDEELLYLGSEQRQAGGYLHAVKAGASGDITPVDGAGTSAGVLWSTAKAGPPMASPLLYQGLVYVVQRRSGIIAAYDAKTGGEVYKKRVTGAKAFWATPWALDGKVYVLDDTGTTHVLKSGPEFQVLVTHSIEGRFWASPAMARGSLILRDVNHLYCIRDGDRRAGH